MISHLFSKAWREQLLQDEVNETTAERAYLNYLHQLSEVAHLEMAGTYKEEDRNILHVFARTKDSPHLYFYRKLEDGFHWTSWEKVELDIEGDHLVPVVFNRRPMIFWPVLNEKPQETEGEELSYEPGSGDTVTGSAPGTKVEIKMAYSEWANNKWQPKKISNSVLISEKAFEPENYFFKASVGEDGLTIDVFYHKEEDPNNIHFGGFLLNNSNGALQVQKEKGAASPSLLSITNAYRRYQKLHEEAGQSILEITESLIFDKDVVNQVKEYFKVNKTRILNNTPHRFKITYPVTSDEILADVPFFYEDNHRVFFVKPSEQTYSKDIMIELQPERITKIFKKPILEPLPVKDEVPTPKRHIDPVFENPELPSNFSREGSIERPLTLLKRADIIRLR